MIITGVICFAVSAPGGPFRKCYMYAVYAQHSQYSMIIYPLMIAFIDHIVCCDNDIEI